MSDESMHARQVTSDSGLNPALPALSTQHSALPSTQHSATDTAPKRGLAYWDTPRTFTLWQRIQIAVLPRIAVLIINCNRKNIALGN